MEVTGSLELLTGATSILSVMTLSSWKLLVTVAVFSSQMYIPASRRVTFLIIIVIITIIIISAVKNDPSVPQSVLTITEKAPIRAFSWLKATTSAFTFKTLFRHYAKRALTPRSLNVKLGPGRNYHEGWAAIRHYANQTVRPL